MQELGHVCLKGTGFVFGLILDGHVQPYLMSFEA